MQYPKIVSFLLIWTSTTVTAAQLIDSFLGPRYLPPHAQLGSQLFNTLDNITHQLRRVLAPPNSPAVVVSVRSATSNETLLDFSHDSAAIQTTISVDTIFRIGSVSKVFTVLSLLVECGFRCLEERVVDHVPEIQAFSEAGRAHSESAPWDEITLGALAGQIAGIPRDYNLADLSELDLDFSAMGFPPLDAASRPNCAHNETDRPCSRSEFFNGYLALDRVFEPYRTPAYSNSAFRILAYAIANITNKPYQNVLNEAILSPLNLTHTSLSVPSNLDTASIPGDLSWSQDMGDEAPTGGMYSSANDLSKLASAILTGRILSAPTCRRWLKPSTHTARLDFSVGMPWEIHRFNQPQAGGRVVDLYAKSGSIGAYESEFILIPDYNVSVVVLVAGTGSEVINEVTNVVLNGLLPRFESLAQIQAGRAYAGIYCDQSGNSSLQLAVDQLPGLVVESWHNNGVDIVEIANQYSVSTSNSTLKSIRLFPAGTASLSTDFRAVFQSDDSASSAAGPFSTDDGAWAAVDQLVYGRKALDHFTFAHDSLGKVLSVSNAALRNKLDREETC